MNNKIFYYLLLLLVVVFSSYKEEKKTSITKVEQRDIAVKEDVNKSQPNIIVLLCDDLGYGDLGVFGHPTIKTENLDKLALSGIKLTNFYAAAPVCSPSRVGLLTGRSPNRAGIYDFIPGRKKSPDNRDLVHLQAHEVTIASLLKSVGYATCLVGKWHCSSQFNSDNQPQPNDFGFHHWFATHNNAIPSHKNPENFIRNGEKVGVLEGFSSQIIVDEAIDWLDKKDSNKPFFLEVAFHEPHEAIASPEGLVQKYLPHSKNRAEAEYFSNVENVDIAIGRLIAYLEKNNITNTLVVFSSDNGPETLNRTHKSFRSYGSPGDLKGMKLWTNEAGFRVPGIISWLGNEEMFKGTSDNVVSALDFLPTFCELAGANLPDRVLDGESFASLFNTGEFKRTKPLLWAFYDALNMRRVAMRHGDYKIMASLRVDGERLPEIHNLAENNIALVKCAKLTDFVLFNLKEDKSESEDVAKQKPELFNRMKKIFESEYNELLKGSHVWVRKEEFSKNEH